MREPLSEVDYQAILAEKDAQITRLWEQIALLKKALFAARSERRPLIEKDPGIVDLFGTVDFPQATSCPAIDSDTSPTRKRRPAGQERKALPEHLERRTEIVELPADERNCQECGHELREIGEEVTEELEIIPMQVFVRRIVRKKYACPADTLHGVFRARMPARAVPKGIAGPGLLAHVLISRYMDHLPLERQEKIFARNGISIPKSTLSGWMGRVCQLLAPLLEELKRRMLASRIVNCDETRMIVQNNARGGPKKNGYLWSYIGDSKWVWFEWHESRGQQVPLNALKSFSGDYLQSDGYAVYGRVAEVTEAANVGCWAHARRKFIEAQEVGYENASSVIALIAKLYAVEKEAKDLSDGERKEMRTAQSLPLLDAIKTLLQKLAPSALPKSKFGMAIGYTLDLWPRLVRYCEDGALAIDNNIVERAIRPVALGRKNWLFAGSEGGAQWAAGFYSLIETAKLCGVDPGEYLAAVLKVIADYEDGNEIAQLMPDAYAWRVNASALSASCGHAEN